MNEAKKPKHRRRGRVFFHHNRWWIDFSRNGKRHRESVESATNESEAWDALDKRRAEVREGRWPDVERVRYEHLAARLEHHYEAQGARPRLLARYRQSAAHLAFFKATPAREIADNVDAYVVHRRREGAQPATIKLELGFLGRMFRVAKLPAPDMPRLEIRNVRQGFFEPRELRAVLERLSPELAAVTRFGAMTGWRKSEILGLEWKNVDLARGLVHLPPGTTKNGQGRTYPVGAHPELAALLREQRELTTALERAEGRIVQWVFHRAGTPIKDLDHAWKRAVREAKVPGRLFHDLRRTAVRNLERARVPRSVAMKLTGHLTESVFKRYAIVDETDLAEGVAKLAATHFGTRTAPNRTRSATGESD
jgi:integrase